MEVQALTVPEDIYGIPGVAFGGYVAGMMAEHLPPGPVAVTLRRPPPLAQPMELTTFDAELVLTRGADMIATAAPLGTLDVAIPAAVTRDEAEDATRRYAGWGGHPYPRCFNCGPDRTQDDGLRIFPGPIASGEVVAAPWTPRPFVRAGNGTVLSVFLWSALDCPTYWGLATRYLIEGSVVTASIAAQVFDEVRVGDPCIVLGWPIGRDGRRLKGGAAVTGPDGRLIAAAEATWVLTSGTVSDRGAE